MHEKKWRAFSLKPFKFVESRVRKHKRSNSDLIAGKVEEERFHGQLKASCMNNSEMEAFSVCAEAQERQLPCQDAKRVLKQEIQQLQEQLQQQVVVRNALEKALSYQPVSHNATTEDSVPKPAMELIKDIAVLELEVVCLEQYLLSLYRKTFDQQASSLPSTETSQKSGPALQKGITAEVNGVGLVQEKDSSVSCSDLRMSPRHSNDNLPAESNDILEPENLLDSSIHRSYSSLSQRSPTSIKISPLSNYVAKAVDSYHSLPLSMLEQSQRDTSNFVSLGAHLGTNVPDQVQETPNWLSVEMIKCVSAIYCELAEPPLVHLNFPFSPSSVSSLDSHYVNPFHIEDSKEPIRPYDMMSKVKWISRDSQRLNDVKHMIKHYRSLVNRLEEVDPRKMKQEEKLAFWINVHNALVMHALLVYGIPKSNVKRVSLVLKAAYNVGGQTVNIDAIQSSILGCRLPRPGQWLRQLFSSKTKSKLMDSHKAFAVDHPEPLLHFALCSGSHSDPAVRVYTPKTVLEELEAAKEEYLKSTFSVHKGQKILLPKIVESYGDEMDLCPVALVEMIEHLLPDCQRKRIQNFRHKRAWKGIDWIPHDFNFRFLLSKELACSSTP